MNSHDILDLDPAKPGVFLRYPESPFDASSVGNPYPYGMDPVSRCFVASTKLLRAEKNNFSSAFKGTLRIEINF